MKVGFQVEIVSNKRLVLCVMVRFSSDWSQDTVTLLSSHMIIP